MTKTKSTTIYEKWDIVLLPFPFTDQSTTKRRPALVVSPTHFNKSGEVAIAFITSNLKVAARPGDHIIAGWKSAQLPKPSLILMRFASVAQSVIVKKIGGLKADDVKNFANKLLNFFQS